MVQSEALGVVSSGPSQSWGRKGVGVSDDIQCNNPGVAALAQEGGRQSFRSFTAFWDLNLLFPTLTSASLLRAQPAVLPGGSPSPPAKAMEEVGRKEQR